MTAQKKPSRLEDPRTSSRPPQDEGTAGSEATFRVVPGTEKPGDHQPIASKRSVLIVDPLDESREVLRTALERRGLTIFEASRADQGLKLAEQLDPDLIVLDLELEAGAGLIAGDLEKQSRARKRPIIMLGAARRTGSLHPGAEFVAKPYHYGPLIRKIEQLVTESQRPVAKAG